MCNFIKGLFKNFIGEDEFGNKYYVAKFTKDYLGRKPRFVEYNGSAEPSKIPPSWHAWLHYLSDDVLKSEKFDWQRDHLPNLTGTKKAYSPKKYGARPRVSADYIAWFPWGDK